MRHDIAIAGSRVSLRPVRLADAGFILALRGDLELGRFLNATSPRLEDQQQWLEAYEARPGDYYFIVEEAGDPVGTVGIYDIDPAAAAGEWGRWLIRRGSLAAVESAVLTYRVAFEWLDLDVIRCRTVAANAAVVSFHDSSGAERLGVLKDHVTLSGRPYDVVEHQVTRLGWARMQPRLEALADRLARR